MSKRQEALWLAEELLADIELSRLDPTAMLLKASRLARLVSDDQAREWISFELNGYPNPTTDESDAIMASLSRWDTGEEEHGFFDPLSDLMSFV